MSKVERYSLKRKDPKDQLKYKVTIVADSNDGDYITTIEYYSQKEFDEFVVDDLSLIKRDYGGNGELEGCHLDNDYINIPFNGHDGNCHSLESLEVEYVDYDNILWDVHVYAYPQDYTKETQKLTDRLEATKHLIQKPTK